MIAALFNFQTFSPFLFGSLCGVLVEGRLKKIELRIRPAGADVSVYFVSPIFGASKFVYFVMLSLLIIGVDCVMDTKVVFGYVNPSADTWTSSSYWTLLNIVNWILFHPFHFG
jgi:hypothetical protein